MENNKSQAEIYREERKERLAKAAAKQAKKSPKLSKSKKMAGKIISIVLAVVIAFGAIGGILNFFGVPQKVLKVAVGDSDYSFSVAEFNYYYYNTWYNYQSTAYQYEANYGEGMGVSLTGYDYTKIPTEQEYTDDMSAMTGLSLETLGNPENATWADAFTYAAISNILQVKYGVEKAAETGIVLTEEQEKEIEDYVSQVRDAASSNDYSLDRWLHSQFGKGLSEDLLVEMQTEAYLATAYYEKLQKDTTNAITSDEINAEYSKNPDLYDILSARIYIWEPEEADVKDDATAEEKKAAEEAAAAKTKSGVDAFLKRITDEKSFITEAQKLILSEDEKSKVKAEESTKAEDITYADLEGLSEDLAKWAYDDARKVGDKTAVKSEDGSYTVIYITATAHKDTSISSSDVRHILISFPDKNTDGSATTITNKDGSTKQNVTSETKRKTYDEAKKVLDEYLKDPTVEKFAELTKKHTDDVDSKGNPNNDGLYENVADDGTYVEAFTKWAIDENRKAGDTEIVETPYGYHIMYYVEANGDAWYESVKNAIFAEKFVVVTDDVLNGFMDGMKLDGAILNWAEKAQCKHINKIIMSNF